MVAHVEALDCEFEVNSNYQKKIIFRALYIEPVLYQTHFWSQTLNSTFYLN